MLTHFLNVHSNQGWARLKSGVQDSIRISYLGVRGPSISIMISCIPGSISQEARSGVPQPGPSPILIMDAGVSRPIALPLLNLSSHELLEASMSVFGLCNGPGGLGITSSRDVVAEPQWLCALPRVTGQEICFPESSSFL